MNLTWTEHEPQDEYLVYSLSVASTAEEDIRAAIEEAVAQMCRLADANVTQRTQIVLFEWDAVYSTLTVVYTDRERSFDAREVLKVFVEGWEAETDELSEDEQLQIWEERDGLVRAWLRRALRSPGTQASLASLAGRGVVPAFTAQHHATEFEPL